MKLVVTGLTGSIGSAFLRRREPGRELDVVGIARREPSSGPPSSAGPVQWVPVELGSPQAPGLLAEAFPGADAVVHLAWAIHPGATEAPMDRTNRVGTAQVLDAAAQAGVPHVVCASSVAAYSPAPRWRRISEDWPRGGVEASAYSRGKAWLEQELDAFEARHPETVLARVRPCAVVQPDSASQLSRWMLSTLFPERLLGTRWLPLPFWAGLRAQLVHAEDVADALWRILDQRAGGAFNIADEPVLSASELASVLGGPRIRLPLRVVRAGAWATWRMGLQPLHPGWLTMADQAPLADTTRAREELGWRPRHDAADTLREVIAAVVAQTGTASPPLAPVERQGLRSRLAAVSWGRPSRQSQA
jgi:UDP-glucose 4-epimerase